MKASELTNKSTDELKQDLLGLLKEQFNLRMQNGSGQLSKPHRLRDVGLDIARVKTILNERKKAEKA